MAAAAAAAVPEGKGKGKGAAASPEKGSSAAPSGDDASRRYSFVSLHFIECIFGLLFFSFMFEFKF